MRFAPYPILLLPDDNMVPFHEQFLTENLTKLQFEASKELNCQSTTLFPLAACENTLFLMGSLCRPSW